MINQALYSSRSEEWETPPALFAALDGEFHFTLDPAASNENAKCAKFYTVREDGLRQDWGQERVFLNPPYGKTIDLWVRKAAESALLGALVVCLIHVRTDTRWWHEWVMPFASELRFFRGRLRFVGSPHSSPFPSVLVIYRLGRRANLVCFGYEARGR